MKRRIAMAAFVLALMVFSIAPGAQSLAFAQRGGSRDQAARMLTGHVFGHGDEPLQKAIVYLKNMKSLAIKTYITDPDGSYRFPALSPNVDYEVYAEHQGGRSDTKTLSAFDSRKQVNITLKIK